MKKEDLKRELENVSAIYAVGITKGTNPNWDKGIWRTFRLFYIKDGILNSIIIDEEDAKNCPYWNARKKVFESRVLGSNRVFGIVYGLSNWLFGDGYKLKEQFLSY
jgi:hypothetical protein